MGLGTDKKWKGVSIGDSHPIGAAIGEDVVFKNDFTLSYVNPASGGRLDFSGLSGNTYHAFEPMSEDLALRGRIPTGSYSGRLTMNFSTRDGGFTGTSGNRSLYAIRMLAYPTDSSSRNIFAQTSWGADAVPFLDWTYTASKQFRLRIDVVYRRRGTTSTIFLRSLDLTFNNV